MRTCVLPLVIFVAALISLPILGWLRYHSLLIASWHGVYTAFWQIAVTLILLIACFFIIQSKKYGEVDRRWAYATVGTIFGYWVIGYWLDG
jgi:hypothetical protein